MRSFRLRATVAGMMAALASAFAAIAPASAQCVAGLGASPAQLALQTWPASAGGRDFTSFYNPADPSGSGMGALPNLQYVATDGRGDIFVFSQDSGLRELTMANGQLTSLGTQAAASGTNAVFYADGSVWLIGQNGSFYSVDTTPSFALPEQAIGTIQGTVEGATFDGQYVWFSTSKGSLVQVQPPSRSATGAATPASVVSVIPLMSVPLGNLVFDGQYIWLYGGSTVYKFDPRQNALSAQATMSAPVNSISFDGVFLWVGSPGSTQVTQIDPLTSHVDQITVPVPGHVVSEGSSLIMVDQAGGQTAKVRLCDNASTAAQLPGKPIAELFDGTEMVLIYGNNMLSFR